MCALADGIIVTSQNHLKIRRFVVGYGNIKYHKKGIKMDKEIWEMTQNEIKKRLAQIKQALRNNVLWPPDIWEKIQLEKRKLEEYLRKG